MIHKLFTAPLNLVISVGEKVKEEVDKEWYDLNHIQKELLSLQIRFEMNEIGEEVYKVKEEELIRRFERAKELEQQERWDYIHGKDEEEGNGGP
ncbi:gas vesicle protein GvpG [Salinithrix halophila]|uniref:Gas vesicle protein GvpG n=1 Tax=Salinithrix halophila TaxID=1485204 RepID=A0ABV8JJJ0_9BACL